MAKIKNSHSAPILTWKSKNNHEEYYLELKDKIVVGSDKYNKSIDINIPILSEIEFTVYCSNQNTFEIDHSGKKQLVVLEKKEKCLAQGERYKIEEGTFFSCCGWDFIIYKPNHSKYLNTKLDMKNYAKKGRKQEKISNKFNSKITIENKVILPTIIIKDDPISIENNKELIMTDDFQNELKKPISALEPNKISDISLKRKMKNLKCNTKKFLKKTKGNNISDAIIIESSSSDEENNNQNQEKLLPIKIQENSICQIFYMNESSYYDFGQRKFFTIRTEDEDMNDEPKIKKKKEQSQTKTSNNTNNDASIAPICNQTNSEKILTLEKPQRTNGNEQLGKKMKTSNQVNLVHSKNDIWKKFPKNQNEQIPINNSGNMQIEIFQNNQIDEKKRSQANFKLFKIISDSKEKISKNPPKTNNYQRQFKENENIEFIKFNSYLNNQTYEPLFCLEKSSSKYAFSIYIDEEIKISEEEIKVLKGLDILVESNPLAKYGFYILNRFTKNLKNLIAFNTDVDFVNFKWVSQILKMKKIFDYNNFMFSDLNFSSIYDSSFNSLHLKAKNLNKMNEGFLKNYAVHIPRHYQHIELLSHLIKITGGIIKNESNQNKTFPIIYIALKESDVVNKKLKYYSIDLILEGCITHELDFDRHQFKRKIN